jgi:CheY-like chemotaxis protein
MSLLNHHILLVDDNEDDRYLLQRGFRQAGYTGHLKFVSTGEAALAYLQLLSSSFSPALIVLDFNLPGLNGADLLGQIIRMDATKKVPVVFYSGDMRPLVRELLLSCGATACIEKPTSKNEISSVVLTFLQLAHYEMQSNNAL